MCRTHAYFRPLCAALTAYWIKDRIGGFYLLDGHSSPTIRLASENLSKKGEGRAYEEERHVSVCGEDGAEMDVELS